MKEKVFIKDDFIKLGQAMKLSGAAQSGAMAKAVIEKGEVKVVEKSKASIALDKLAIKNKEGITLIDPSDIILIQREEKSTVIYTSNERISTSEALGDIQEKLDMRKFMRSHKSYIINVSKITKIYPYGRWTYVVKLKDTEMDALLTHENYSELKDIFNL